MVTQPLPADWGAEADYSVPVELGGLVDIGLVAFDDRGERLPVARGGRKDIGPGRLRGAVVRSGDDHRHAVHAADELDELFLGHRPIVGMERRRLVLDRPDRRVLLAGR
jgi:hypothetical protein